MNANRLFGMALRLGRGWLAILLALGGISLSASDVPPLRVAVVHTGATAPAREIVRAISRIEGIEAVSGEADPVLARSDVAPSDLRALGTRFAARLVLLVSPAGDAFGYVDVATGEEWFRIREDTQEELVRSAFALVEELRDAERVPRFLLVETAETHEAAEQVREWMRDKDAFVLENNAENTETGLAPGTCVLKLQKAGEVVFIEVASSPGTRSPSWKGGPLPEEVTAFLLKQIQARRNP